MQITVTVNDVEYTRDVDPRLLLVHFLRDLANALRTYYNAEQFIVEDAALRNARLMLVQAVQQVIRNGLTLLGVSAPDTM